MKTLKHQLKRDISIYMTYVNQNIVYLKNTHVPSTTIYHNNS